MRVLRTVVAVAVFLTTAASASAQVGFKPRPEKDPYRDLFDLRPRGELPAPRQDVVTPPPSPPKPFVVCGTLIVPADPNVDPKIRVAPPAGVEHTMRTLIPPMCKPQ